jgi:hypothetical protein
VTQGRPVSTYLAFQWPFLALVVAVGLLGMIVPTLLLWGVASLAYRITKAAAPRPAAS